MICRTCHSTSAARRADYAFGALCDDCSLTYMSWPCPDCGEARHGIREHEGEPCGRCEILRIWNPLPAAVQEEIDRATAELGNIMAIKRIRELAGCGLREAMMLHNHRGSVARDS